MITTTTKNVQDKKLGEHFRHSLQNLTSGEEFLSDDIKELEDYISTLDTTDDFLFWDNKENTEVVTYTE